MTTAAQYLGAVMPPRIVLLGQSLRSYTLGHAHILTARGNPFAPFGGRLPGPCDLVEAVFILCHEDFQRALDDLASPFVLWKARLWGRLAGRLKRPDIEAAILHLLEWRSQQWKAPVVLCGGGAQGRTVGTPLLLTLYQHLRWTRNMSHADAMNSPAGFALWDYAAHREVCGKIELANDMHLAALQRTETPA